MSGDKDLIYLAHIAQCIEAIKTYTVQGKNEEFLHNSLVQDAVLRRLQIMAESSQRLSDKLKAKAPVDWKALSGFRNILVHDYLGGISLFRASLECDRK